MENQNNRKEALRLRIEQVIKSRETGLSDLSGKTIDEILQEISIYHQELEFQNLELMRIQDELQMSEKHYEELFSNAPIGYVIIDANSIIHSANAMFAEMFDQKPVKLKSQNLNQFVHPDYQDRFYLLIKKVLKEKTKSSQLIRVLGAKKEYFVKMECNLLNTNGKDLLRIGSLDVTREVRNEQQLIESRERYRAVADFAYHWEYWQDPEGRLLYMSPSCERITGYNKNDFFLNPKLIEDIVHPEDKDIYKEHNKFVVIPGEKVEEHFADVRINRKDGKIRWVGHVCQNIFSEDGTHLGLRVTNKEITDRKQLELLQQVRLNLFDYASKHSLNELLTKTLDEIEQITGSTISFYHFLFDDEKTISLQAWSSKTSAKFCKTPEAGLHYNVDEAGVWVDCVRERRAVIHNNYESLKHKKGMPEGHAEVIRELVVPIIREGKIVAILGVGNKTTHYDDNDIGTVSYLADVAWEIAQKKRADEEIKKSEQKANSILNSISDAFFALNNDFVVTYFNQEAEKVLNRKASEVMGKHLFDSFPEARGSLFEKEYSLALKEKAARNFEVYFPVAPYENWYEVRVYPQDNGISVYFQIITERKNVERKLADQQLVMSDILESTLSGYWDWNISANVEYYSPALKKMLGYEYHELPNVPETWQNLIFSDDLPGVFDVYDKHVQSKGKIPYYNEVRYKHKDGSTIWVICAGRVIEWKDDGTPVRMVGCHVDITQRKKLEEKLKENELKLKQKNEEYAALNKELLQANNELRQTSDKLFQSELNLKKQYEESAAQNEELLQTNEELQTITEELTESNDRNSALVEANPDLMFVFDRNGVFLDYHAPTPQSLLLKPEEFLNRNANGVLPGYLADITMHAITQLFETGETQGYSYTVENKGKKNHFDARMVKYGNNNALTIVRDVTDQKIAEEKLRQSQETYLGIINSVSESIYVQDEKGVFLEVNDAAIASYGLKRDEVIGKTPERLSEGGKNDLDQVAEMVKKAFNGEPQRFEFWGRKADGTVFPDEVTLTNGVYFGKRVVIALARNISESKKAEEALRESEERFRGLYENATVGIYRTTIEGEIVLANPTLVKMLGYDSFDDLKKRNLSTEGYDQDYSRDDFRKEIAKNGRVHAFESKWKVKDGSAIYISESARVVSDEYGKPMFYEGIVEDITHRKRSELVMQTRIRLMEYAEKHSLSELLRETLREAEILTHSQIGFYHFIDEDNGKIMLSQWSERTENELCSVEKGFDMHYPIEKAGVWVDCVRKRKPVMHNDYEALTHRKGLPPGHAKVVRELGVPVFRNRKIVAVLGIGNKSTNYNNEDVDIIAQLADLAWDIAERKIAEEQLHMLSKGIEQSPAIVVITDTNGNIEFVNPMFTKVTGYSFEEALGQNPRILKSGKQDPEFYQHLWDTILDGKDWFGEMVNMKKSGENYWESALISPIKDDKGEIRHFIAIKEDITERKKADEAIRQSEMILKKKNEEYLTLNNKLIDSNERIKRINTELITAREKAEESDKLKTAFLANMSHEIRTPMNAIIGFSEILLKPTISKEKQGLFTQILNTSCHQLLSVVDDMIDIAKIETGQMDIHMGEANINEAITRVQNIFTPQAVKKNVEINVIFQLNQEFAEIETDPVKLNQILTNLLSNAVKFTEEGEIELGYTIGDGVIQIYVRDTGIGIKPEHHEIIFERFRQVEVDYTRQYGGTGLGLPICKAFVEMLGGRIWVESEFEKGSTFFFTLPCNNKTLSRQQVNDDEQVDYNLSETVILVAEDEEANFIFLSELLTEVGATVIHAADGIEAVKHFRENTNIDVVLMDIKMPKMDGIEATKAIKEINEKVPVIAITAYALAGDREKCLAAGCDEYISKPVRRQALLGLIQGLLEN